MRYKQTKLAPLLPAILLGAITSSSALAYNLIDLGANVEPKAINNNGVLVGSSNTDQYPATAFSWSSGSFKLISGGISANAVNNTELIAGGTVDGAFIDNRDWSDYGAFGINQAGYVAGYKVGKNLLQPRSLPYNPAIYIGTKWMVYDIARLYPRGTRKDVYADRFILNSINTNGLAVGYKYRYGLAGSSAILIDTTGPVNDSSDVNYFAGGRAVDINENNKIVGTISQAFIYDYDLKTLVTLPVLEGGLYSSAYDINELNQVAGRSESANGYRAVIWDEMGDIEDLNNMLSADTGWVLTSATAMNDSGDIVGTGTRDGVAHGFLLTTGTISGPPPAQNEPPVAAASADVYAGKAPLMVNFDSSGSSDPDGEIAGYSWEFMDGSFSTDMNPTSHEFTIPGTYQVTLTVTDNLGMSASDSITITVRKGKAK